MNVPDTRASTCKGAKVGAYLACLKHSKEANVAGEEEAKGDRRRGGQRGKLGRQSCETHKAMGRTLTFTLWEPKEGMGCELTEV